MTIDFIEIGKRVRENRKSEGYTQAQLAEAVNLSTEYICEIETGRNIKECKFKTRKRRI